MSKRKEPTGPSLLEIYRYNEDGEGVAIEYDEPIRKEAPVPVSEFFVKNGNKKPVCNYKYEIQDLENIRNTVGKQLLAGELSSAMASMFVIAYARKHLVADLDEEWVSFGVTIGKSGDKIDAFAPLDLKIGNATCPGKSETGNYASEDEEWMMSYILFIYRLSYIKRDDYRNEVVTRALPLLKKSGQKINFNLGLTSQTYSHWLEDHVFCQLVASIDMFLNKMATKMKSFLVLRFGTQTSRFKDCGALMAYQYVADMYGLEPLSRIADWIFTRKIARCFERLIKKNEEIGKMDSYMPYLRDLALTPKSPYSTNANAEFTIFVHTAGVLAGAEWSKNAIMPGMTDAYHSAYCGLMMAYGHRGQGEVTKVYGFEKTREVKSDLQTTVAMGDVFLSCQNPTDFCAWARTNKCAVHDLMTSFVKRRHLSFKNTRPNTVGEFVKITFLEE